ncbi:Nucleic acid-binding [Abeliophyllum distichum]|uniref:Nucleic acid-binding n=1 Tax=Abeliophyllum distichum TaxID=126358 RepID=A0ABD1Q3U6_9LAMI
MVIADEHDRYVLELRKKEQQNKRHREWNAEARREQIQCQHHGGSSHVAAAKKRLLRNRQRREVIAKEKELREQEYAYIEGGVSLQNKRSRHLVQLACDDNIIDECTVENEFPAGCEGVLHDRRSTYIMAFQPKLFPDISPSQTSWTTKVVVAQKNISRTAQRSPVKYQNMVLVDPQGNKVHATIYNNDITVFQDTLILSKAYLISNATGKHTNLKYRATAGPIQWTINGRTRIEEIDENHDDMVFSTYNLASFDGLQEYMDSKDEIVFATNHPMLILMKCINVCTPNVKAQEENHRPETSSGVILTFRGNSFSRGRKGKKIVKPIKWTLFSLKDLTATKMKNMGASLEATSLPS